MATNLTYIFNMVITDFWIGWHSDRCYKDMWLPWARSSLEGLGTFFEYGTPCVMIECAHWWVLEILVGLSGYLSVNDFDANTVVMNMFGLIYMIPLGVSYATSSFVGMKLAEGRCSHAIKYSILGWLYGQFLVSIFCICLSKYGHGLIGYFAYKE